MALDPRDFEDRMPHPGIPSCWPHHLRDCLARPFDVRQILYTDLLARPRRALTKHLRTGSLLLAATRQCREAPGAFVAACIAGHKAVSAYDINYLFPLHFDGENSNLSSSLVLRLSELYGQQPTPRHIFAYVYAILYCPSFSRHYRDLLRRDFARIPFPRTPTIFSYFAARGEDLILLHLLQHPLLERTAVRLRDNILPTGNGRRTAARYDSSAERLHLDREDLCFEGISPQVWSFTIGGYHVLRLWLDARSHGRLTYSGLREFRSITEAIRLTLILQQEMCLAFEEISNDPIAFT
jgi:Type ISP C-terminal specificity domain